MDGWNGIHSTTHGDFHTFIRCLIHIKIPKENITQKKN